MTSQRVLMTTNINLAAMRLFCLLPLFIPLFSIAKTDVKALVRVSAVSNNAQPSFLDSGTGTFRISGSRFSLSQALLDINQDITSSLQAKVVVNAYDDGDEHLGFTQAYLHYKPLTGNTYRVEGRAGFFYPKLSVENTDIGWLSRHFITSSAINSWIGEELRVPGLEVSLARSGRKTKSPWSWKLDAAAYKGNDTLGALIAFKGFGLHDRQSLHNEDRIQFADIPTISDPNLVNSPTYTSPFTEIDGKIGYYLGFNARYLRKLDLRYFYYNNRADPLVQDQRRLYSWRTEFNSLAARYLVTRNTELSFHLLDGLTEMGDNIVFVDYTAFYTAISHTFGQHKLSARVDIFNVDERDTLFEDPSDSHGLALTTNWTYRYSDKWQTAVELIGNKNNVANRATLGIATRQNVVQLQFAVTYRF